MGISENEAEMMLTGAAAADAAAPSAPHRPGAAAASDAAAAASDASGEPAAAASDAAAPSAPHRPKGHDEFGNRIPRARGGQHKFWHTAVIRARGHSLLAERGFIAKFQDKKAFSKYDLGTLEKHAWNICTNLENSWKPGMHELVVAEVKGIGRRCCRPVRR